MKLFSAFLLLSIVSAAPAFADSSVAGTCQVVNALGSAEITLTSAGGKVSGATGDSKIKSASASSYGVLQYVDINYDSQLAASTGNKEVKVTLVLMPSPATALSGINYVGVLTTPIEVPAFSLPGPFQLPPDGWNNPFPGLIPVSLPVGYVAFASASCSLAIK